jgi:hypothetical protein
MFELRSANPNAYRLALSATPAQDRPIDLWGVLEWIHPGRWGAYKPEGAIAAMQSGYWKYARYYHYVEKTEYGHVVGATRNNEIFQQRFAAVCHVVVKSAVEAAPWSLTLEKTAPLSYSPRTAILTDTRATMKRLAKQFPEAICFSGAETPRKRGKMIIKAREEGRGIICTMHSVRESIDLTHWNIVRYAQVPWALLPLLQSMGRFHRLSSLEPVSYFVHVAGPFEEEKAERLCAKVREIRSVIPKGLELDEYLEQRFTAEDLAAELAAVDMSGVDFSDGEF